MLLDGVTPSDDDDKVRRNLVAFGTAVLLLVWLEIPLSAVLEKLVGSTRAVAPLRLWGAGAVVLFYLAIRFHFNGGGKTAFNVLTKQWQSLVHWDIDARMKSVTTGNSSTFVWSAPISEALCRAESEFEKSGYNGKRTRSLELRQDTTRNEARWTFTGKASALVNYWNSTMVPPSHIFGYTEELQYRTPLWLRALISIKALWGSWLYSEQAVALMFPVWLALAASATVGFRLGQLVLGS